MSESEELLRLASDLTPFNLPIGVYVVTRDGRFVNCNRRAREILQLPPEGEIDDSIARFYRDPANREKMHQELMAAEARGQHLEKLLSLDVNGQEIFVRDYTRSLSDKNGELLGYVCCMTDVSEGERSNRLLDALPAGVYKLDANDHCETANRAFARILGYDSPDRLTGSQASISMSTQPRPQGCARWWKTDIPNQLPTLSPRCAGRTARRFLSTSTLIW